MNNWFRANLFLKLVALVLAVITWFYVKSMETPVETISALPQNYGVESGITVNVPNEKGGYTSVVLKRWKNGFQGPQGEFYADFPKVAQLRLLYGK